MFLMGEEGKPPIQMSVPQAWLHAAAEAAVASMIAHYARGVDGLGQHIVVNAQACVVWTLMNEQAMPLLHGDYLHRSGVFSGALGRRRKMVYRCKDGHVSFVIAGGAYLNSTNAVIAWMKEEGAAPAWLAESGGLKSLTPGSFMTASEADLKELDRRGRGSPALLSDQDQERTVGKYSAASSVRCAGRDCRRYRR